MTLPGDSSKSKVAESMEALPASLNLQTLQEGVNVTFDNIWKQAKGQATEERLNYRTTQWLEAQPKQGGQLNVSENEIAALRQFVQKEKKI
ncbi:MAG: hypothetical protein ABIG80_03930, partial [Patescibacteria group bacterium]